MKKTPVPTPHIGKEIRLVPIDQPKPYDKNGRVRNAKALEALGKSIKEFGFTQPILVDKDGVIITGHTRLDAAKKLGLTEVPIMVADWLTPEQVRLYRIADNRLAENTSYDPTVIKDELAELVALVGRDGLDMTGFNNSEIGAYIGGPLDDMPIVVEELPPEPKKKKPKKHICPACSHTFSE